MAAITSSRLGDGPWAPSDKKQPTVRARGRAARAIMVVPGAGRWYEHGIVGHASPERPGTPGAGRPPAKALKSALQPPILCAASCSASNPGEDGEGGKPVEIALGKGLVAVIDDEDA